jgi:hypothetical protein
MLPAAGDRNYPNGGLSHRGIGGYYWSSTESGSGDANDLFFYSSASPFMYTHNRRSGFSVRCAAE